MKTKTVSKIITILILGVATTGCASLRVLNESLRDRSNENVDSEHIGTKDKNNNLNSDNDLKLCALSEVNKNKFQSNIITNRVVKKVELKITPEVKKEIDLYSKSARVTLEVSLTNKQKYYTELSSILDSNEIPREMLNIPAIESAFRLDAGSAQGAVGLWQFMRTTAHAYGLNTKGKLDERKDPRLSTIAAARHLKDLYEMFGDWYLALAAYNAGSGAIKSLLAQTKTNDFWSLLRSGKLAKETARYVPKFIAMTLIANDPSKYGFTQIAKVDDTLSLG